MFISHKFLNYLTGVMVVILSLSSCHGIFHGIYDEPLADDEIEFGFISVDDETNTGTIYIDATDYTEWHYINLRDKTIETRHVDEESPTEWDFAIHRYDAKTNAGSVLETSCYDFTSLPSPNTFNDDDFIADIWTTEQITIDMSQMMDGIIIYAEDFYNQCLSQWLDVDTSIMPPIYTLSGKVYMLRLADGTYAALRLSNFMSDAAIKGFMTIDYFFPIEL